MRDLFYNYDNNSYIPYTGKTKTELTSSEVDYKLGAEIFYNKKNEAVGIRVSNNSINTIFFYLDPADSAEDYSIVDDLLNSASFELEIYNQKDQLIQKYSNGYFFKNLDNSMLAVNIITGKDTIILKDEDDSENSDLSGYLTFGNYFLQLVMYKDNLKYILLPKEHNLLNVY